MAHKSNGSFWGRHLNVYIRNLHFSSIWGYRLVVFFWNWGYNIHSTYWGFIWLISLLHESELFIPAHYLIDILSYEKVHVHIVMFFQPFLNNRSGPFFSEFVKKGRRSLRYLGQSKEAWWVGWALIPFRSHSQPIMGIRGCLVLWLVQSANPRP